MSPTDEIVPEVEETIVEKHVRYRAERLLDLGFTLEQVLALATKQDVVHDAEALLSRGCDVTTAFDILSD